MNADGPIQGLAGVILAGGRSRRMGRDKRFLDVGGTPLIDRVRQVVASVCGEVLLVAAEPDPELAARGTVVVDVFPGTGTLGGAYTGLLHARADRAVVVACDMPRLNAALLRSLAQCDPAADVVMPKLTTGLQPTHAMYRKSCLPHMERLLKAGELKTQRLIEQAGLRVVIVEEAALRQHDPELLSFLNLNTPADLEMARKLWAH